LLLLIPRLSAAAGTASGSARAPEVQRAQAFWDRLSAEAKKHEEGASSGDAERNQKELAQVDSDLRSYLGTHPGDSEAVLMLMNFYFLRAGMETFRLMWTQKSELGPDIEAYGAIVDRALEADSMNAKLHFWRGRLYAGAGDWNGGAVTNARLPEAIRETRRAIALDPKDTSFHESLASILFASGDESGAREEYHRVRADHPMYLVLHDWERLPAIQGLEPISVAGRAPEALSSLGVVAHMYLFHGSFSNFMSEAHRFWPGLKLAGADTSSWKSQGYARRGGYHLVWSGDALKPAAHGETQPDFGAGGVWMDVTEMRVDEKSLAEMPKGTKVGDVLCSVSFLNLRAMAGMPER